MKLKDVEENWKRRQSSFSLKRRRHSLTSSCLGYKRILKYLKNCYPVSGRQHIVGYRRIPLSDTSKKKMKTTIILSVTDWLWLFASLFGFNYHVPFRLSKIHFDYLVASKVGREVILNSCQLKKFVRRS